MKTTNDIIIDSLILNEVEYKNVLIKLVTIRSEDIEVTAGGFYEHGPKASSYKEFRPGLCTNKMIINLNA